MVMMGLGECVCLEEGLGGLLEAVNSSQWN